MIIPQNHLWPWQEPGSPLYSIRGPYELAYVDPARARATGHHGWTAYLFAAYVRLKTRET